MNVIFQVPVFSHSDKQIGTKAPMISSFYGNMLLVQYYTLVRPKQCVYLRHDAPFAPHFQGVLAIGSSYQLIQILFCSILTVF